MPNFEDFQQLKSWKRQGASAPTKFYKSNKENISCPIAVYSRKLWKSKTNFEHWKFMKSHLIAQYREIIRKLRTGWKIVGLYQSKLSEHFQLCSQTRGLFLAVVRSVYQAVHVAHFPEYWNKRVAQPLTALHHFGTQKVILCLWHRERSRLLDAF